MLQYRLFYIIRNESTYIKNIWTKYSCNSYADNHVKCFSFFFLLEFIKYAASGDKIKMNNEYVCTWRNGNEYMKMAFE